VGGGLLRAPTAPRSRGLIKQIMLISMSGHRLPQSVAEWPVEARLLGLTAVSDFDYPRKK